MNTGIRHIHKHTKNKGTSLIRRLHIGFRRMLALREMLAYRLLLVAPSKVSPDDGWPSCPVPVMLHNERGCEEKSMFPKTIRAHRFRRKSNANIIFLVL